MPLRPNLPVLDALLSAFSQEFETPIRQDLLFGNPTAGMSDGHRGVQWNTWVDTGGDTAFLAVNLEGPKHDDWPIARFIERGFRRPLLFDVCRQMDRADCVEVLVVRDAWRIASRPAIRERHIGVSGTPLSVVDATGWRNALEEAYHRLDASNGYRGRATHTVTAKRGPVALQVSPHLQFRWRLGSLHRQEWRVAIGEGRAALTPLHDYIVRQSAP